MFEYPFMNDIMRIVKEEEPEILSQSYDMDCSDVVYSSFHDAQTKMIEAETARILDEE